jgi:beta-phosphoglucomutase family hydrolase
VKLHIPDGSFEGFIFDCDGTLADTMPMHYQAWMRVLARHGVDFTEHEFYHLGGTRTPTIVEILNAKYGKNMVVEQVVQEKEVIFRSLLPSVEPLAVVVDFARKKFGGHPMSVASGGMRHVVVDTLKLLGILEMFPVIITAEDVIHGKPAPDIFLLAAEKMGVEPEKCLVFEDAPPGIQAARAAGMAYVFVPSSPVELDLGIKDGPTPAEPVCL